MKKKMNIMQNFKDDGILVGSDWSCNEMAPADTFSIEHPVYRGISANALQIPTIVMAVEWLRRRCGIVGFFLYLQ